MQTTKRQHYVPKLYLAGFADANIQPNKFVWAYNKKIESINLPNKPVSISSICYEDFYYAQTEDGDDLIEKKIC
ncbi:DUF4238 domain-containing protein [Bdellovibrio sp. HCB185ZH]|uniref:DUF4238 domain-containing protein n=1 Tax=Bdellovibrio sp. HCB185ZH TaxID=3394235 RepID=UPI0039A6E322